MKKSEYGTTEKAERVIQDMPPWQRRYAQEIIRRVVNRENPDIPNLLSVDAGR